MTSSGLEPSNFKLVAYHLNQLRYRMALHTSKIIINREHSRVAKPNSEL
jgi:hypothetical protein